MEAIGVVDAATGAAADSSDLLLDAPAGKGSDVIRRLAGAGIYPAEVSLRRQSLEAVFIELIGDHPDPAVAAP